MEISITDVTTAFTHHPSDMIFKPFRNCLLLFALLHSIFINANSNVEITTMMGCETVNQLVTNGASTGASGTSGLLCVGCTVSDESSLIDNDLTNFSTLSVPVGLLGHSYVSVEYGQEFPAGTRAGFVVDVNGGVLGLLNGVTIVSYRQGVVQQSISGANLINLLGIGGGANLTAVFCLPFDELRLQAGSLLGALATYRVFYSYVDENCSYPVACGAAQTAEICNDNADNDGDGDVDNDDSDCNSNIPVIVSISNKDVPDGSSGVVLDINTSDNNDTEGSGLTYSFSGSLSESPDELIFNLNTTTGEVSFVNPPDHNTPLDNDMDNTYQFEVVVTDSDGFMGTQTVQLTVTDVIFSSCTPVNQLATNGAIAGLSGDNGVCVLCDVEDEALLVDSDLTNFATIDVTVGVLNSAFVSVEYGQVFPAGTRAGFALDLNNSVLGALNGVALVAYNGGTEVGRVSDAGLLDILGINLLGIGNVSTIDAVFCAPFDELRIEVGGLALALAEYRVFYSYVDETCSYPVACGTPSTTEICNDNIDNDGDGDVDNDDSDCNSNVPVIVSVPSKNVPDGSSGIVLDINTNDNNDTEGNGLIYSFSGDQSESPDELLFSIDANTGEVSFVNPPDHATPLDNDMDNTYQFEVIVTDSDGFMGTQDVQLTVFTGAFSNCGIVEQLTSNGASIGSSNINRGFLGALCLGCSITNTGRLVDSDLTNFASLNFLVGLLGANGHVSVKYNQEFPAGTRAGFILNVGGGLLSALDGIALSSYRNNSLQQTISSGNLLSLLGLGGNTNIGAVFCLPFDELRLTISATAAVGKEYQVFYSYVNENCSFPVQCGAIATAEVCGDGIDNDGDGKVDSEDEDCINNVPQIVSMNMKNTPENDGNIILDINTNDAEDSEGNGLTYSFSGDPTDSPDETFFVLDTNTGTVSFNAAPNFEAPQDANGDNVYQFEIIVTDSGGLTDQQIVQIRVTNTCESQVITLTR